MKKTTVTKKSEKKKDTYLEGKLDTPAEVAVYYGFKSIISPNIKRDDLTKARELENSDPRKKSSGPRFPLEERIALLRNYSEKNWSAENQPVSIYYQTPLPTDKKASKPSAKHIGFGLEIMGTTKSIAEALIIETAVTILKEEGFANLHIEINSLGGPDSTTRFTKEITAYYRKHLNDLPANCRQAFKDGVFDVFTCQEHESCLKLSEVAPQAVSFLNETDRLHFQEILEFLESTGISYRINNSLVGNRTFETGTIFEIREEGNNQEKLPLAYGARYEGLAKKLGLRRDVPSVGISVNYERKNKSAGNNHRIKKPKVFYIQLGFEAKCKSLGVIEMLRQAKIPVYQSISRDRLAGQFSAAEKMGVPYIMIMGQKEAMENSVILRNLANRSQETVPIAELPKYLRKI